MLTQGTRRAVEALTLSTLYGEGSCLADNEGCARMHAPAGSCTEGGAAHLETQSSRLWCSVRSTTASCHPKGNEATSAPSGASLTRERYGPGAMEV